VLLARNQMDLFYQWAWIVRNDVTDELFDLTDVVAISPSVRGSIHRTNENILNPDTSNLKSLVTGCDPGVLLKGFAFL
jgi:hypothetical protein